MSIEVQVQIARDQAAQKVADANAKFAELQEAYNNSPERQLERDRARLAELQNDPYHLNKKLGGSAAAAAEEQSLRSRIAVAEAAAETARREAAVAGEKIDLPGLIETTTDGQLPMGEMISAVDDLRALNDICIGEAINGVREHAAIIAEAKALFEARMADSEWVRKLNAGDPATGVRPRHRTGPAVCIAHVGERAGPPGASTP